MISGRRAMADWYSSVLKRFPDVHLPTDPGPTAWSNYPILLPLGVDAEAFQNACHLRGYQVRRYYWPTLAEGFTEDVAQGQNLKVSTEISERAVCLPLYVSAEADELVEIEAVLTQCLESIALPGRIDQRVSQ
jgi:dTDP-4-amino-4,6-dideoxygalactose transaminase